MTSAQFRIPDNNLRSAVAAIDFLLGQVALHTHDGDVNGDETEAPDPPDITVATTGGSMAGGQTFYYGITLVDSTGRESALSEVTDAALPAPVTPPAAPTLSYTTTGGFLPSGVYSYVLSAYADGNTYLETTPGWEQQINVPVGTLTNVITVTFPTLPAGADGWNVYRRDPTSSGLFGFINTVDMTGATPPAAYVDTGSIPNDCNRLPATANGTNRTCQVTVEYPGGTVPVGHTWRIYRSLAPNQWANSLLHWVVEETTEGSGVITPEFVDVGVGTSPVAPPSVGLAPVPNPAKVNINSHTLGQLPASRIDGAPGLDATGTTQHQVVAADGGGGETDFGWAAQVGATGVQVVDRTGSAPGALSVNLSATTDSTAVVVVYCPDGGTSAVTVSPLPDPVNRGPFVLRLVPGDAAASLTVLGDTWNTTVDPIDLLLFPVTSTDATPVVSWATLTLPPGLPDYSGAADGDVLTIDTGAPVWAPPDGGDGVTRTVIDLTAETPGGTINQSLASIADADAAVIVLMPDGGPSTLNITAMPDVSDTQRLTLMAYADDGEQVTVTVPLSPSTFTNGAAPVPVCATWLSQPGPTWQLDVDGLLLNAINQMMPYATPPDGWESITLDPDTNESGTAAVYLDRDRVWFSACDYTVDTTGGTVIGTLPSSCWPVGESAVWYADIIDDQSGTPTLQRGALYVSTSGVWSFEYLDPPGGTAPSPTGDCKIRVGSDVSFRITAP